MKTMKVHYNGDGHKRGLPWIIHIDSEIVELHQLTIEVETRFISDFHKHPAGWIECTGYLWQTGPVGVIRKEKPRRRLK